MTISDNQGDLLDEWYFLCSNCNNEIIGNGHKLGKMILCEDCFEELEENTFDGAEEAVKNRDYWQKHKEYREL